MRRFFRGVSQLLSRGAPSNLRTALRYSLRGLTRACREHAFRLELALSVPILPLALLLGDSGAEKALLACSWLLVLIVELLNTAVEAVVDLAHPGRHELAAAAKDLGSAAVLLSLFAAALVWACILFF
ncbi:MAG: diacylglycerol kinase [Gammaproteobacteria bacterium]|nr:diacylglycerol kinase [Gammaproteobacteria bacterium]